MQRLRRDHGQCSPLLSQLRQQALSPHHPRAFARLLRRLLLLLLVCGLLVAFPPDARAAEVLTVSGGDRLQVGDRNRSYGIELGCLKVDPSNEEAAANWLRVELPRGTRVNLRPLGERSGRILARVSRLADGTDLGKAMIAAGLAAAAPCEGAVAALIPPAPAPLLDEPR